MSDERRASNGGGVGSRRAAYRALRRVSADAAWSGPAVDTALRRSGLDARDRSFAANLAYSTLRWQGTLDWALATVVTRGLDAVQPEVLDVLRLGAWQLLYGSTPDRAVVDTAVELTRREIGSGATGFVNGVLRRLARTRDRLPWPPEDDERGMALRTGYPPWVVTEATARFGERAFAVLAAGNVPPGVTLRATGDRDALAAELAAAGLSVEPARHAPEALRVPGAAPGALACVAEGRAVVQDEASLLVTRAAAAGQPASGWSALDACAAPGGKSTHLAALGAHVVATDVHHARARQVAEAAQRTHSRVAVVAADAARPPWRDAAFDVVLLDAPCTGLGVVRRRPELRWRREPGDPRRLSRLQAALLESCARLVCPGGTLVYSVCTFPAAETVEVVREFLALHGDRFSVDSPAVAGGAGRMLDGDPGVQLDPDGDDTDAMYFCRFRRRSEP